MTMNHSNGEIEAVGAVNRLVPGDTVTGDEFAARFKQDNEASHMIHGSELSPSETRKAANDAGMSEGQIDGFLNKVKTEANFTDGADEDKQNEYAYLQLNTYLKFDTLNGAENYQKFGAEGVSKIFAEAKNLALEGEAAKLGQLVDQYGDRGDMTNQQLVDLYNVNEHSYNHFNGNGDDYFHWTHITALNHGGADGKPADGSTANTRTGYNDGGDWGQWVPGEEGNYNNLWDIATKLYDKLNQSLGRSAGGGNTNDAPTPSFETHNNTVHGGAEMLKNEDSGSSHNEGGSHTGTPGSGAGNNVIPNTEEPMNMSGSQGGNMPSSTGPSLTTPSSGASTAASDSGSGAMDLSSLPPWLQKLIMDAISNSKEEAAGVGSQGAAVPSAGQAPGGQTGGAPTTGTGPSAPTMSADALTSALQGTGISAEQFMQQAQIEQGSPEIQSMVDTAMQDGTMSDAERGAIGQALAEQTFEALGKSFDDVTPENQVALVKQLVGAESEPSTQTETATTSTDLADALEDSGISVQEFEQATTSQEPSKEIQNMLEAARSDDGKMSELEQGAIGREMAENIFESMGKSLNNLSPQAQMAISGYCSNCLNADAGMAMDNV